MITKNTILAQIQITEGRFVNADFIMVVLDDGRELVRSNPHTLCIAPDSDLKSMREANSASMEQMGWPVIDDSDWLRVSGICAVEHTPEIRAQYAAWKELQK